MAIGWEGGYLIGVLAVGLFMMAREVAGPDFVMLGMLAAVMATGDGTIITVKQALAGFANEGLLTVVVLFVVAAGISETGGLDYSLGKLLGSPSTSANAQLRLMLPVTILSAVLNNTPVVAILIPVVLTWCEKAHLAPGQLFIPLSFASILGGTLTLIGTSTNLVVAGLQKERFPDDPTIGLFSLTRFGLPVAITGMIYIVLFSPLLLPGGVRFRKKKGAALLPDKPHLDDLRILVGLQVTHSSPVVGKSILDAGMRGLPGMFLASVKRGPTVHHAVSPEFVIAAADILVFTGRLDQVEGVANRFALVPITDEHNQDISATSHEAAPSDAPTLRTAPRPHSFDGGARLLRFCAADQSALEGQLEEASSDSGKAGLEAMSTSRSLSAPAPPPPYPNLARLSVAQLAHTRGELLQATVRAGAPCIGSTVRDTHFRSRLNAAIVSLYRRGVRHEGLMGEAVLEAGDFLILLAGEGFDESAPLVASYLEGLMQAGVAAEREFIMPMQLQPKSRLVGQTVAKAGLRGLPSLFLVSIEHQGGGRTVHAVGPEEVLEPGDVLWFAGSLTGVAGLRRIPGLLPLGDPAHKLGLKKTDRRLVQAVISRNSALIGKTLKETRFRTRYGAAVIAVHRQGQRETEAAGGLPLRAGDVLLLDTGAAFAKERLDDRNFALVSEVDSSAPPRFERVAVAVLAAVAMIAVYTADVLPLVTTGLMAAGVMLLTGCLSGTAARKAIKWDVYLTIACAFGLSSALEESGVANGIATLLVDAGKAAGGDAFILAGIYLATALLSNLVANNAAAALMFPIAMQVAGEQGIDKSLMSYNLMLAASACFATPFGYQTNLMVYGAGGYTFNDFLRFGGPMQLWQAVASLAVILLDDQWLMVWAVVGVAAVLVFAWPALSPVCMRRLRRGHKKRKSEAGTSSASFDASTASQV